jgi:hypothetical protein
LVEFGIVPNGFNFELVGGAAAASVDADAGAAAAAAADTGVIGGWSIESNDLEPGAN